MASDFKIVHFDPGKEPFIDRNGNQWVNVLFEGYLSEPTKWVMQPKNVGNYHSGDTVYGRLEDPEGKNYKRFYKEQKPDVPSGTTATSAGKPAYQPKDEHAIAKAVALKAAVNSHSDGNAQTILKTADRYLAWLEGSSELTIKPSEPTYTPDPMNSVHNENPMNDVGESEPPTD